MRQAARAQPSAAGERAWVLLWPIVAIAGPLVALLARPVGDLVIPDPDLHYWTPELVVRKPAVQAGYLLVVAVALTYTLVVLRGPGLDRMAPAARRVLAVGAQAATLVFLAVCWVVQSRRDTGVPDYFSAQQLMTAAAIAGASALALWRRPGAAAAMRAQQIARRVPRRVASGTCLLLALLATVLWLLPAVATDASVAVAPVEVGYLARFTFDEALAVLNGRSPFVNVATYGALWPYAVALPLDRLGASFAAFSTLMTTITLAALVAVYATLRRVARSSLLALVLYLPFLATSLLVKTSVDATNVGAVRYYAANYFGVLPVRYAGPYLLAWLTVRFVDGAPPRRRAVELLFFVGGLVALNNVDFGVPAVTATAVAVLLARPPSDRATALRMGGAAALGLAGALAAVVLLTLVRAGSLPHFGMLTRYGRVFALGGYGNLALPALGMYVVVGATLVGALAVAATRARSGEQDRPLTAMLAWSGVFGLGACAYYVAYRSHPTTLIDVFSSWALAVALLTLAIVRAATHARLRPTLPALAVLFCFGLMICTLAQVPSPAREIRRLGAHAGQQPLLQPAMAAEIAAVTHPGERVAILDAVGHRTAREAGVVNVSPYTGMEQVGASEQIDDTLELLAREGGRTVFLPSSAGVESTILHGAQAALVRAGFSVFRAWPDVRAYRRSGGAVRPSA